MEQLTNGSHIVNIFPNQSSSNNYSGTFVMANNYELTIPNASVAAAVPFGLLFVGRGGASVNDLIAHAGQVFIQPVPNANFPTAQPVFNAGDLVEFNATFDLSTTSAANASPIVVAQYNSAFSSVGAYAVSQNIPAGSSSVVTMTGQFIYQPGDAFQALISQTGSGTGLVLNSGPITGTPPAADTWLTLRKVA